MIMIIHCVLVEVKKVYKKYLYMTCTMAENTHLHKICTCKYSYAIFYLNLILNTYTDTPDIVYNIDALSNSFFR